MTVEINGVAVAAGYVATHPGPPVAVTVTFWSTADPVTPVPMVAGVVAASRPKPTFVRVSTRRVGVANVNRPVDALGALAAVK